MLDSARFLPEKDWGDPVRRKKSEIPAEPTYWPTWQIALELLDRALSENVVFAWLTFDEWYSISGESRAGLEARYERYVAEVRKRFRGWLDAPRRNPRAQLSAVENLCPFSIPMMRQPWHRVDVKNSDKGPMVWEVKQPPILLPRDVHILGSYWLIYSRNVLELDEVKYCLPNGNPEAPLELIVHLAFAQWPVERTLEDEKGETGLSYFEVRNITHS
jgi:hypothetical protein